MTGRATFRLDTPRPTGRGALALVAIYGDIDGALAALAIKPVAVGQCRLRDLAGVDHGVVARWSAESATLMPHAGPAVVRELMAALSAAGLVEQVPSDAWACFAEAASQMEAQALLTLSRAASPMAVDLLLAQAERWAAVGVTNPGEVDEAGRERGRARSERLGRLVDPPLVVAIGPPNIGKSTLLNTLAGRPVSIVADEPGTTRDHVGALLDLAGLVVRYADAPGIRSVSALGRPAGEPTNAAEIEQAAAAAALELARTADVVLLCGDAEGPPLTREMLGLGPLVQTMKVCLRSDRTGRTGASGFDARVSAHAGTGIDELARLIRDTLVPPADLASGEPWVFW